MKRVFLDTNVIIDFLADRQPFAEHAAYLFELSQRNKVSLFVAAISINNTYYILRQVASHKKAIKLLSQLQEFVTVYQTDNDIISAALKSDFTDFEDAIQYFTALKIGKIDIISTSNSKDFKRSELPVLSPETTVKLLLRELD